MTKLGHHSKGSWETMEETQAKSAESFKRLLVLLCGEWTVRYKVELLLSSRKEVMVA